MTRSMLSQFQRFKKWFKSLLLNHRGSPSRQFAARLQTSMAGVVEAANGAFDLDATVSPCAICMSPRGDLVVASCGNLRHGACRSCLKMALTQPARRHPIGRGDGAMGCVAAGCGGSFDLRSLLGALDDAKDKGHVLKIVADLRKKETTPFSTAGRAGPGS